MISKDEVELVMSKCYLIDPPKHLLILDKPAFGLSGGNFSFYKGLQPKWRGDMIILTPEANAETIIHETLHANFGVGEFIAYPLGRLLSKKLVIQERALGFFPRIFKRERTVKYVKVTNSEILNNLSELFIKAPPDANPVHYMLAGKT